MTAEGLRKIFSIKASINKGLSEQLNSIFPNIIPAHRPLVEPTENINPYWLAGFIDGEGCFSVCITKSKTHLCGHQVQLKFALAQHRRDLQLMKSIAQYLECGMVSDTRSEPVVLLNVHKFSDIIGKIIPFMDRYCLEGVKKFNYADFCKVALLMHGEKSHLTIEGLNAIKEIKAGMNTGRT